MDIIMQHCVSRGRRKNGEMISKNKNITRRAFSLFKMFPNGPSAFLIRIVFFGKELSLKSFFTGLNPLEWFLKCLLLLFPSPFLFPCRNSKFETRGGFAICGKCVVVVRFSFSSSSAAKMAIYPCSIVGKTFRTRGCCVESRTSWNGEITFFLFTILI